jgi:hypothetical protein
VYSVHPCECGGIHESEALSEALFPIPPGGFNFSADGALAWPYLPGLKVRILNVSLFFLFYYLLFVDVGYKS